MEQVESYTHTRGGKRSTVNYSKTPEGLPMMWTDHLDADPEITNEQPLREAPEEITIKFMKDEKGRGVLHEVKTKFGFSILAINGKVMVQTAHDRSMRANKQDLLDFAAMFWEAAKRFIENGRVRAVEGHNYLPVFDNNGAFIPDSYYEEGNRVVEGVVYTTQSGPAKNYEHYRADGTPIQ